MPTLLEYFIDKSLQLLFLIQYKTSHCSLFHIFVLLSDMNVSIWMFKLFYLV